MGQRWEGGGGGKGGYRGTEWEMKYMSIDDVYFVYPFTEVLVPWRLLPWI